ncbi:MAG TPA: tyrosine-protein phosphatase [Steroidobacteraceae bacterium]|nr:tyrosine-protein phosphatase [Steroidobacteraceae bacterium]
MHAPSRYLQLEGGCNFRDAGGHATEDGRTVRWGRVYRAGVLRYLTPADAERLSRLGVRAICDLRRAEEREREPTRWPARDVTMLTWADGEDAPGVTRRLLPRQPDAEGMRAAMLNLYRDLPRWMVPRVRGLFECVAQERLPLVVHCSAGKDRTGFAVAMLHAALGVGAETLMQDYLYTNEVGNYEEFVRRRRGALLGVTDGHHPLFKMPADIRRVLFAADPDYMRAALEQIDSEFGGLESYLAGAVGLSAQLRGRMQEVLLTSQGCSARFSSDAP